MRRERFNRWELCLKKGIVIFGLGLLTVGMNAPVALAAQQTGTLDGHPLFDNHFEGREIDDSSQSAISRRSASYSPVYDPRTTGMVTAVENQGEWNTCWAFATIAAVECNLIKKGYADSSLNLSENHLAYFFYNRQNDKLGNTQGDYNLSLGNSWAMNGGTLEGTALSLTTWAGVVKETVSEDDSYGEYNPTQLPASDCYKSDYRVKNVFFYNYDVNTIKQAITQYGAVASGIYMGERYLDKNTGSYYCTESTGNHAVTIVGWDDNYSRYNFNITPKSDGAWIVKNSWGDYGDGGYLYVSYEDNSLNEIISFDVDQLTDSYDNNYQYDGSGNPVSCYTFSSGTEYANVFKAKAASGYNEILKAVSVDVYSTNVSYKIQVYSGLSKPSNPTSGKLVTTQNGQLANAGYNQIKLSSPPTLEGGEYYSIVVTLYSASGKSPYMACDASVGAEWISFVSSTAENQSFVKYQGKWTDLSQLGRNSANLRIKAYTDNTNEKVTYKLNNSTLGVSKGGSAQLSLKTTPSSVKRKVTWSSSNKKVATVSSSGKVKGKSYGTATIKATFVKGSSQKTLKCKVTVGPSKVKGVKVKGGKKKLTVTWNRNSGVSGYVVYYSKEKDGNYKALTTITANSKTKYTKNKMAKGTYYVKVCSYLKQGKTKLYGSSTAAKKVTIK